MCRRGIFNIHRGSLRNNETINTPLKRGNLGVCMTAILELDNLFDLCPSMAGLRYENNGNEGEYAEIA